MNNKLNNRKEIFVQNSSCSEADSTAFCAFDIEIISEPTSPILHQQSRFIYVKEGEGQIKVQNHIFTLKSGSLISILPWQYSEIISVKSTLKYVLVIYKFDVINDLIKSSMNIFNEKINIFDTMFSSNVVQCDEENKKIVESILDRIFTEVGLYSLGSTNSKDKNFSSIFTNAMIVEILIIFNRLINTADPDFEETAVNNIEIFQYIFFHLNEKITLKHLSSVFFMSESAISKYIMDTTGLSYMDLITTMRITRTINFLLYTDLTLEQLAQIIGYVDASHISKVFNAKIGMKISEYRKTYSTVNEISGIKESKKGYQIISYIFNHYVENLSIQDIAYKFAISESELNHMLKYHVEKTFDEFLNYVRITNGAELLLKTKNDITSIARQVGFQCPKTFTRNFIKYYNLTPNKFRKQTNLKLQPNIFSEI